VELSSFMDNLCIKDLEELEYLDRQEWAGIFNKVMDDLRQGVKLKSVQYSTSPTEFALTPYEMLMYDIKSKKAKLKPPSIPVHVEKAAKERILDAIRSRPPLKPMNERKLKSPKQEEVTPMQNLLNEIRGGTGRQSLRRTKIKRINSVKEASGKVATKAVMNKKVIIDLDESFATAICNFEESPDNSMIEIEPSSPEPSVENEVFYDSKYDGAIDGNENELKLNDKMCGYTVKKENTEDDHDHELKDLTLEEVRHIRCQITLAELERLDLSKEVRKDYSKGRICFQCAKTRFNMFHWAYSCQMCRRKVCKACCNKIRLPSLKLADIQVSSLKSQLKPREESKAGFGGGWQRASLRSPRNPRKDDSSQFVRSKTLTKAEIDLMKEKAFNAATEALGVDHVVCTGCKDLLASMVGWKKGKKSPRKKSILDLQTVTISKRRCMSTK